MESEINSKFKCYLTKIILIYVLSNQCLYFLILLITIDTKFIKESEGDIIQEKRIACFV